MATPRRRFERLMHLHRRAAAPGELAGSQPDGATPMPQARKKWPLVDRLLVVGIVLLVGTGAIALQVQLSPPPVSSSSSLTVMVILQYGGWWSGGITLDGTATPYDHMHGNWTSVKLSCQQSLVARIKMGNATAVLAEAWYFNTVTVSILKGNTVVAKNSTAFTVPITVSYFC